MLTHLPRVLRAVTPVHQVFQRRGVLSLAAAALVEDGARLKLLKQLLLQLLREASSAGQHEYETKLALAQTVHMPWRPRRARRGA